MEPPNRAAYVWNMLETKEASEALQANVESLHQCKCCFFARCYMEVALLRDVPSRAGPAWACMHSSIC